MKRFISFAWVGSRATKLNMSGIFCSVNEVKMSFECKYLFVYVCCMLMSFLSRKMDKWTVLGECQQTHFRLKGVPLPQTRKTLAKALPKRTKEGLCPHLTFGFTFTSSSLCFHACYQNVNQYMYFIMINLCWFQSFFCFYDSFRWIVPSILRKFEEGLFFSFLTSRWPWILNSTPETLFSESREHSDKVD